MSETAKPKARFPIVLTIVTLIAFSLLCGLGAWQVKRLAWKEDLLARIEKLKTAPAIPLAQALARADKGEDVSWTRVSADCDQSVSNDHLPLLYGVRDGDIVWRARAECRSPSGHGLAVLLDLGVVDALTGQVAADNPKVVTPSRVVGVLALESQRRGASNSNGMTVMIRGDYSPYDLMVETATPAVPGVTPAPLPAEISNRHLEYALTWFGLAVTLLFIYAAMLWRKMRS